MPRIDTIQVFDGNTLVMTAPTGTYANSDLSIPAPVWASRNLAILAIAKKATGTFKVMGHQMDGHAIQLPPNRHFTVWSKGSMKALTMALNGAAKFHG
jgi:hypothetical protein